MQPPTGSTGQGGAPGSTTTGNGTTGGITSGSSPDGSTANASTTGGQAGTSGGQGGSNSELIALLNKAGTRWSAAVIGDQTAAGYILDTNTAVYCIGGWSGSDNNVTLTQFKQLVAGGKIHYFIASGGMGGGMGSGGGSSASEITSWVTSTFKATTVGGSTVYDLTTKA